MHAVPCTPLLLLGGLTCVSGLPLMAGVLHSTQQPNEPAAREGAHEPLLADGATVDEDPALWDFWRWRFTNGTNDTSFVASGGPDEEPEPEGRTPMYDAPATVLKDCAGYALRRLPDDKVELLRRPPDDRVELHSTGGAAPSLPRTLFPDTRLADFLHSVGHIYVICVKCWRTFPQAFKEKVSLVKAALSDSCIQKHMAFPAMSHQRRVTFAHRVAIADARERNVGLALVVEEDVLFTEGPADFDYAPIRGLMLSKTAGWDVIRLAWYDHNQTISKQCEASKLRMCTRWVAHNMCTAPSCDLHSSAAYILPARSYDRFLTQGRGVVDSMPLNQFNQTVVTPALGHQLHYLKRELKAERAFVAHCRGVRVAGPL